MKIIRGRTRTAFGLVGVLAAGLTLTVASPGYSIQIAQPASNAAADAPDDAAADASAEGEAEISGAEIYTTIGCAGCHGEAGGGGRGPALNGSLGIRDAGHLLNQIINGSGGMPAFGEMLSDEEVLALATWIRDEWGGRLPLPEITLEDVAAARG
ncbi:MAG: cytochrome c [Bauldia sp.]|nr:cytochrome c [Bauldia sp.]